MNKLELLISRLKDIIECARQEQNKINVGEISKWNTQQLKNFILPEMNELLVYALKGQIFFKYGKSQRLLETTYLMTDSLDNLNETILGEKITELQKLYNSL